MRCEGYLFAEVHTQVHQCRRMLNELLQGPQMQNHSRQFGGFRQQTGGDAENQHAPSRHVELLHIRLQNLLILPPNLILCRAALRLLACTSVSLIYR